MCQTSTTQHDCEPDGAVAGRGEAGRIGGTLANHLDSWSAHEQLQARQSLETLACRRSRVTARVTAPGYSKRLFYLLSEGNSFIMSH